MLDDDVSLEAGTSVGAERTVWTQELRLLATLVALMLHQTPLVLVAATATRTHKLLCHCHINCRHFKFS